MLARFNVFDLSRFQPNARYLIIASGIFSISFFGIQMLLKVLYMLRLGYGLEYIGLFSAVGALMYMGFSLPSGALGVRFGLYPTMFAGGVITVIGMFMLPLVEFLPAWAHGPWPILSQMVLTTGWSLFGINQVPALMAITTPQNRDSAYALNGVLRGMGAFVGTVIGGLLPGLFAFLLGQNVDAPAPYRYALWLGGGLSLLAFVPLSMIRRVADVETEQETPTHAAFPALMVGMIATFVFLAQAGSSTCQAFCSAYMDTDLALTPAVIGLLTGIGQLAAIFAPLLIPILAARRSNGWTLLATTLGMTIFMTPLVLSSTWLGAGIGRIGLLGLAAMWTPALQVFQMELVEKHWRSLAYGAVSMAMGLSFGTISLVGGYIAATAGYRSLFLLGMVMSASGFVLLWAMQKLAVTPFYPARLAGRQS